MARSNPIRLVELIRRTNRVLSQRYQGELSLEQYAVLEPLNSLGPKVMNDLSKLTGMDRTPLHDIADRMVALGFVTSETYATGQKGRQPRRLTITADGMAAMAAAELHIWRAEKKLIESLPARDRGVFLASLRTIAFSGPTS